MLHGLGKRRDGDRPERLVERFQACHDRIRGFFEVAARVGAGEGSADERADAAADVARYFRRAFAQHVVDEDEIVGPRLAPSAATILERLHSEHERDQPDVEELILACDAIAQGEAWPELAKLVASLASRVEAHLAFEEAELFPILGALPGDLEREILDEMQARRGARR